MEIHEFYYDQYKRTLYVEFSTDEDSDEFYRNILLEFEDVQYYSTTIINSPDELRMIDKDFIVEFLIEYFKENDLPEKLIL